MACPGASPSLPPPCRFSSVTAASVATRRGEVTAAAARRGPGAGGGGGPAPLPGSLSRLPGRFRGAGDGQVAAPYPSSRERLCSALAQSIVPWRFPVGRLSDESKMHI